MSGDDLARHMVSVAREILGDPNAALSKAGQVRYGTNGSLSIDVSRGVWFDHELQRGGGVLEFLHQRAGLVNGEALDWLRERGFLPVREAPKSAPKAGAKSGGRRKIEATYDYLDEHGEVLFQVVRYIPKEFRQRRPDKESPDGWAWGVKGIQPVLYRLPDLIEAVASDHTVFIVEGERLVEALAQIGVVATCNPGGAGKWRDAFGAHLAGARVVILPDNDKPGRGHRDDIVEALSGVAASLQVVDLPGLGEKDDVVNWIAAGGTADELWRLVEATPVLEVGADLDAVPEAGDVPDGPVEAPTKDALRALGFIFDGDEPLEPPRYLVKHLLPTTGIGIVAGQSGAGKTFTAIELACCLGTGRPFFGHRIVERVGTLILAVEGGSTIGPRLKAVRKARANEADFSMIVHRSEVPDLANPEAVAKLRREIQGLDAWMRQEHGMRLGLIIIDTLIAAFSLQDENNSAEAQQIIRRMKELGEPLGALTLAVHHYGKNGDAGVRGSSAYRAGADVVLSVLAERNNGTGEVKARSLNKGKLRDGQEGPIAGFELRFIELGVDEDGEPFGACVVEPDLGTPAPVPRPVKESLPIVALKGAFYETMGRCGRDVPVRFDGSKVRAVTVEEMKREFRRRYATGESDETKAGATVRQALKRALGALSKHGFYTAEWDGKEWLWRLDP